MKSPIDHDVVQIELTNACSLSCANCTRFCGHHQKNFFMDFDTFKKAVDSMAGHKGLIGIMGGEPTLHPEFEKFIDYYASQLGPRALSQRALHPIKNFSQHIVSEDLLDIGVKRGLWTSLGKRYADHYELIQEVFDCQYINDHKHSGSHQALLISRKELGISDEEWFKLRDNCWIQNQWSPSITPKGAFFCEVAAALDMLFDGPGGWDIEPGWWRRQPEAFGDQLQWCELCSGALQVPRTQANTEIDDISPSLLEKLDAVQSPKVRKKKYRLFSATSYNDKDYDIKPGAYIPDDEHKLRVSDANQSLYIKKLHAIVLDSGKGRMDLTLANNRALFDQCILISEEQNPALQALADKQETQRLCSGQGETTGDLLNRAIQAVPNNDWLVILDANILLTHQFREKTGQWVFNPGCLHSFPVRHTVMHYENLETVFSHRRVMAYLYDPSFEYKNRETDIPLLLFSKRARSLKGIDHFYASQANSYFDTSLFDHWPAHKQILLPNLS